MVQVNGFPLPTTAGAEEAAVEHDVDEKNTAQTDPDAACSCPCTIQDSYIPSSYPGHGPGPVRLGEEAFQQPGLQGQFYPQQRPFHRGGPFPNPVFG